MMVRLESCHTHMVSEAEDLVVLSDRSSWKVLHQAAKPDQLHRYRSIRASARPLATRCSIVHTMSFGIVSVTEIRFRVGTYA